MTDVISGTSYDFNIWSDGREISDDEARELIVALERDPDDAVVMLKLIGYYSLRQTAEDVEHWLTMATWFIRNRPGDWMTVVIFINCALPSRRPFSTISG
jgi:hypothetical protein